MSTIYLDLDSQHRNRIEFPNPNDYTISFAEDKTNTTLNTSINPISDAYPIKEWSWNSNPNIQIITPGLIGTNLLTATSSPTDPKKYGPSPTRSKDDGSADTNVPNQFRVDNDSDGTGLTFRIVTTPVANDGSDPTTLTMLMTAGELEILTYGSGYIPGETLKIHRTDLVNVYGGDRTVITQKVLTSFMLVPTLMTKGFKRRSGYNTTTIYETSGGSGTGMKIKFNIGTYANDEYLIPIIDTTTATAALSDAINSGTTTYSYKEGDILTVLNGTTGTVKIMLTDLRFRIGESYALDISNIVKTNTIVQSSTLSYHHANLEPLQPVKSTSGSGTGMILATIDEPISTDLVNIENITLCNRIAYIFEVGKNYKIGDTVTIEDRDGNEHILTIIEPSNTFSNKNNGPTFYDNDVLKGKKYTEPMIGTRSIIMYNDQTSSSYSPEAINIFDSPLEPSSNINGFTYTTYNPLPRIKHSSDDEPMINIEHLSSLKSIDGNKVYLHNSRTFGLDLYDGYFKGLMFENITTGEERRIIDYDSTNNMLTLDNDLKGSSIQDFWKINNPSTSIKIFVPNGSDNPKEYINQIYEAVIYTGEINDITEFISDDDNVTTVDTVTIGELGTNYQKQYKLETNAFDKRLVHQFRTIVDYDVVSKMITLDKPLVGITTNANKYGATDNSVITTVKYIHLGQNTFANTALGEPHLNLDVIPAEQSGDSFYESLSTNKNASGLKVDISISNNIINNSSDIVIKQRGSGYETQDFRPSEEGGPLGTEAVLDALYGVSDSLQFRNYTQYGTETTDAGELVPGTGVTDNFYVAV